MYHLDKSAKLNIVTPIELTWASYSNLFSILMTEEESYKWILNFFVQIVGDVDPRKNTPRLSFIPTFEPVFEWVRCPFLHVNQLDKWLIDSKWKCFSDFIIECIDNDFFVYSLLEQSSIRSSTTKSLHRNFIYGYDCQKKTIHIADHINMGKYGTLEVEFDKLNEAFVNSNSDYLLPQYQSELLKGSLKQTALVKFVKSKYNFDMKILVELLSDYLNSKNSMKEYEFFPFYKSVFGMDNYDFIISYLDPLNTRWIDFVDYRPFTLVRDHKKIMNMRIEFLLKNYTLFNDSNMFLKLQKTYLQLYEISQKNLSLIIKYNASKDINNIRRVVKNLSECKILETGTLANLINIINC